MTSVIVDNRGQGRGTTHLIMSTFIRQRQRHSNTIQICTIQDKLKHNIKRKLEKYKSLVNSVQVLNGFIGYILNCFTHAAVVQATILC